MDETRKTTGGTIRGTVADGPDAVASFLGVPYAAAPVGPRRFARPEPTSWDGERDATAPGPTAPQGPTEAPGMPDISPVLGPGWVPGSEYLTVDVRTPDTGGSGGSGLPVMVFVHGGSFTGGSSRASVYDGTQLAREGAVVVVINYRLGAPGFAHIPGVVANRGLLDQIAALRWVHDNAAAFGGDPDRITVFGESAGAISVAALLVAAPPGLVRRAVVQSGGGSHTLVPQQAAVTTVALAEELGVTPAGLLDVPDEGLVAALGRLGQEPPDLRVGGLRDPLMGLGLVGPVIDDDLLERRPVDAVAAGAAAGVDLLAGSNDDEMGLYSVVLGEALGLPGPDEDDLHAAVARLHDDPDAVIAAYRSAGRGSTAAEVHDAVRTDWMFGVPTRRLADAHTGRTWRYAFGWRSPGWDGRLGACHGLELPFVFDVIGRVDTGAFVTVDTEETRALAARMRTAWVAFARGGDPGWPCYTADAPTTQRFDTTDALTDAPDGPEQAVWDGVR
ncbi:carboxylesterase/lipase family protein [Actinomycetospora sp. CA-101289]|uniref:carboxylesterase/lipase family protein n=1 Tax=Actinomycetospora sp. CA-101289 TaxID=3239893 RepID=UPI003D96A2AA